MIKLERYVPEDVLNKFEFHNYHHAIEIISQAFPGEWKDLMDALSAFSLSVSDLSEAGGAETKIPGKIEQVLFPRKWRNVSISGDLQIRFFDRIIDQKRYADYPSNEYLIAGYISDQHLDFLKGRVAVELEWNKKDISFDRVLTSLRTSYECGLISAGVIITRSADLTDAFKKITDSTGAPIARKYGSSSTWMGKLLPRLESRQAGGCPILAVGIKKTCIEGSEYDE